MEFLKRFLSKKDVKVQDKKTTKLIAEWVENDKPIDAFTALLKQTDIKFPIILKSLSSECTRKFVCQTADNKELNMILYYGNFIDNWDEIHIEYKGETLIYEYIPDKGILSLLGRNIKKGEKKLINYYSKHFCHRYLYLSNGYNLEADLDIPTHIEYIDENGLILRKNSDAVEEFLINLDYTPKIDLYTVYEKIREIYGFDDSSMSIIPEFKLVLSEITEDNNKKIIDCIECVYPHQ